MSILVSSANAAVDCVAIVALGIISREQQEDQALHLLWAMFLLWHLGGLDTVSASSLVDNDLWERHCLGLVFQIGVALYVFSRSWRVSDIDIPLNLKSMAIPLLVVGILKYGEKTWVLRSSSTNEFRNKLERKLIFKDGDKQHSDNQLLKADFLFTRLRVLFAGIRLNISGGVDCYNCLMQTERSDEAFRLVDFQLGLLFDMLYTKAPIIYSVFGIFVRCFSILASVSALITFLIMKNHPSSYFIIDMFITYTLLIGTASLELYALARLVTSDWTQLLIARRWPHLSKQVIHGKRWSRSMAGYNFIRFCYNQKAKPMRTKLGKLLPCMDEIFDKKNVWQKVDHQLQDLIFQQVRRRIKSRDDLYNSETCKRLLNYRGDYVLDELGCLEELKWSTVDMEFHQSLLLWHIATDLCYYDDAKRFRESNSNSNQPASHLEEHSKIGRCLSDYMLYLLVKCPNLLPKGNGNIIFKNASDQTVDFFKIKKVDNIEKAGQKLLMWDASEPLQELFKWESEWKRERESYFSNPGLPKDEITSGTLPFRARKLAAELQNLKPGQVSNWGFEKKWEMINKIWVELLTYAAAHSDLKQHAQQLKSGGELVTHVSVLMANHALSEEYEHSLLYYDVDLKLSLKHNLGRPMISDFYPPPV